MDDYERKHMSDGDVLYRDKFVAPWPFFAVMAAGLAPIIWALAIDPAATFAMALATSALLLAITLTFSVLRVSVTEQLVHIQLGPFGPKIPSEDIVSAEAVVYDWKKFGGWGIRRASDGEWAYNMMGDAGEAVRIVYRKGNKEHSVVVTADQPRQLASSIRKAAGLAETDEAMLLEASEQHTTPRDEQVVLDLDATPHAESTLEEEVAEEAQVDA